MTTAEEREAAAQADLWARERAASALRRLGHAIVGHDVPIEVLEDLAAEVERRLPAIESGEPRSRSIDSMKRHLWRTPADGDRMSTFPDCVVSGETNPMGMGVTFVRDRKEAVARVRLGSAFEGAPNRAHGGVVAAIFDDLMGFVLHIIGAPAYTGELTVRYLAPTPVLTEIEFRARLQARQGRKLTIVAEATHEGNVRDGQRPVHRHRPGTLRTRGLNPAIFTQSARRSFRIEVKTAKLAIVAGDTRP